MKLIYYDLFAYCAAWIENSCRPISFHLFAHRRYFVIFTRLDTKEKKQNREEKKKNFWFYLFDLLSVDNMINEAIVINYLHQEKTIWLISHFHFTYQSNIKTRKKIQFKANRIKWDDRIDLVTVSILWQTTKIFSKRKVFFDPKVI